MVDKGFNIKEECATHFIDVHVPPGNGRCYQRTLRKPMTLQNYVF